MSDARHTRWLWFPLFPLCAVVFFAYRLATAAITPLRGAGLIVTFVWLVLSIYDWRSRGALRRWLYDD